MTLSLLVDPRARFEDLTRVGQQPTAGPPFQGEARNGVLHLHKMAKPFFQRLGGTLVGALFPTWLTRCRTRPASPSRPSLWMPRRWGVINFWAARVFVCIFGQVDEPIAGLVEVSTLRQ